MALMICKAPHHAVVRNPRHKVPKGPIVLPRVCATVLLQQCMARLAFPLLKVTTMFKQLSRV